MLDKCVHTDAANLREEAGEDCQIQAPLGGATSSSLWLTLVTSAYHCQGVGKIFLWIFFLAASMRYDAGAFFDAFGSEADDLVGLGYSTIRGHAPD
jgi:hypothetical protein